MSFDIHLLCFRDGEPVTLPSEPLLEAFKKNGVHEHGSPVYPELSDGFSLETWSGGLKDPEGTDSVMFAIRSISGSVMQLLFDLVAVPGMMALVAADPALPLVSDKAVELQFPDVGDQWTPAAVCTNVEELEQAILPLFKGWEEWAFPEG